MSVFRSLPFSRTHIASAIALGVIIISADSHAAPGGNASAISSSVFGNLTNGFVLPADLPVGSALGRGALADGGNAFAYNVFTNQGNYIELWTPAGVKRVAKNFNVIGVSSDGRYVGATGGVWDTSSNSFVEFDNNGRSSVITTKMSADGSRVIGSSLDSAAFTERQATLWSSSDGSYTLLSGQGPYRGTDAFDLSADGTRVVGYMVDTASGDQKAVVWDNSSVATELTHGQVGYKSTADIISRNGKTIGGHLVGGGSDRHAISWTDVGGFTWASSRFNDAGLLSASAESTVTGIANDGSRALVNVFDNVSSRAAIWEINTSTGATASEYLLSNFSTGDIAIDLKMSGNGRVVVGYSLDPNSSQRQNFDALTRWVDTGSDDPVTGNSIWEVKRISSWLSDAGIATPTTWIDSSSDFFVSGMSQDGSVLSGFTSDSTGTNYTPFIARVGAQGNGVIQLNDYLPSLMQATTLAPLNNNLVNLAMSGAHHRSLMDNGLNSENCVWATADAAGYGDDDIRMSLTEAGVCGDLGNWRLGLGVGQSTAKQDLNHGGDADLKGQYFALEADYGWLDRSLIGSVTLLAGNWDGDIKRAYNNGAAVDASRGETDLDSWSLRSRLDWKQAAKLGGFGLSPFVSLTHSETDVDGYTEVGGGFPARFDDQSYKVDELRAGLVADMAVTEKTELRISGEAVQQLNVSASDSSAEVLGLFSQDLQMSNDKDGWLRVGAEVDHHFTSDVLLSASVNAATEGGDADIGGSLSLKFGF